MAKIYVGMSGWTYPPWRGDFYPKGLVQKRELEYASRQVNALEINGTFYSLQKPSSFQKWFEETPDDFIFTIKAGQYMTHVQRLKEVEESLCNFFASGLLCLKDKMGPILWQLPPYLPFKDDRFEKFFESLPHDSRALEKMAARHTSKMNGRAFTEAHRKFAVRHAIEVRHPSFICPEFFDLLKKYNVAHVFTHSGTLVPYEEEITSDFIYARMYGEGKDYKKGYPVKVIEEWGQKVKKWSSGKAGKDCFILFGTEVKERSPFDAIHLLEELGLKKT